MNNKENDIYQAVVVCDIAKNNFGPFAKSQAPCLIPLFGKPALHYTLASLKASGIQDVHLFCSLFSGQIRSFINNYQSKCEDSGFKLTVHSSEYYFSLGEVIRDVFAKAIIRNDFVLLYGNTVCNIPFKEYLEQHKLIKLQDKQCVMTLLFHQSSLHHHARRKTDESLIVLEKNTNRLVFFERLSDRKDSRSKKFNIDMSIIKENKSYNFRYDLIDAHVSLCTPAVVSLFTDNFDYQTKKDFVTGIMGQEEILGNTIYAILTKSLHYSGHVMDPIAYDTVAQDMLQRWTYPMVPDIEDDFNYHRHHIYKKSSSVIATDLKRIHNVSVGQNTIIHSEAEITFSIIGSNCKIGKNVKMEHAYIMDDTIIEDNCSLKMCLIGNKVIIRKNVIIRGGSLVADQVVLGPDISIGEGVWIDYCEASSSNSQLVGAEGRGQIYIEEDEDDDNGSCKSLSELWGVDDDRDDEISSESGKSSDIDENDKAYDEIESEKAPMNIDGSDDVRRYYHEVLESLIRAIEDNIRLENLVVELNASKHAYNILYGDVSSLLGRAFMEAVIKSSTVNNSIDFASVKHIVIKLSNLLLNYTRDDESKKNCLLALEEYTLCNYSTPMVGAFVQIVNIMYNESILEEDMILNWYNRSETPYSSVTEIDHDSKKQKLLRSETILKNFIEWLEEAEEESE